MDYSTNPFSACIDLIRHPERVFDTINDKQNWSWIPFVLSTLFTLLPIVIFFKFVDTDFYSQVSVNAMSEDLSPSQQQDFQRIFKPNFMLTSSLIAVFFYQIVIHSIMAAYLNFCGKKDEQNLNGFTDWFGFMWWTSLPNVINLLGISAFVLVASDSQVTMMETNIFALPFWLGIDDFSPSAQLANLVRVDVFLSLYLVSVGIRRWTDFSRRSAWLIAIGPMALYALISILMLFA